MLGYLKKITKYRVFFLEVDNFKLKQHKGKYVKLALATHIYKFSILVITIFFFVLFHLKVVKIKINIF